MVSQALRAGVIRVAVRFRPKDGCFNGVSARPARPPHFRHSQLVWESRSASGASSPSCAWQKPLMTETRETQVLVIGGSLIDLTTRWLNGNVQRNRAVQSSPSDAAHALDAPSTSGHAQLPLLDLGPFQQLSHLTRRQTPGIEIERLDLDQRLIVTVDRMKVRRIVLSFEDPNDDAVETAKFRHSPRCRRLSDTSRAVSARSAPCTASRRTTRCPRSRPPPGSQ